MVPLRFKGRSASYSLQPWWALAWVASNSVIMASHFIVSAPVDASGTTDFTSAWRCLAQRLYGAEYSRDFLSSIDVRSRNDSDMIIHPLKPYRNESLST
jgi:hypothetical protein